jgi:cytochrome P450
MSSFILRLREVLDDPSSLDKQKEWVALDDSAIPPLFIYGESLGLAVIKNPSLKPGSLLNYWKAITKAPENSLVNISTYFERTPLLLHGPEHFEARRSLNQCYKSVEADLSSWLPAFTSDFLSSYHQKDNISPISFIEHYLSSINTKILSRALGVNESLVPEMPGEILQLITSFEIINAYEKRLQNLVTFIQKLLSDQGRDLLEIWPLISITVMGTEPLKAALTYLIVAQDDAVKRMNAAELMNASVPISVVPREAPEDMTINGHPFKKGQKLYIHTTLNNETGNPTALPFGIGVHICPGKKIALIIAEVFIRGWGDSKTIHQKFTPLKFKRDLVLRPKERKNA